MDYILLWLNRRDIVRRSARHSFGLSDSSSPGRDQIELNMNRNSIHFVLIPIHSLIHPITVSTSHAHPSIWEASISLPIHIHSRRLLELALTFVNSIRGLLVSVVVDVIHKNNRQWLSLSVIIPLLHISPLKRRFIINRVCEWNWMGILKQEKCVLRLQFYRSSLIISSSSSLQSSWDENVLLLRITLCCGIWWYIS